MSFDRRWARRSRVLRPVIALIGWVVCVVAWAADDNIAILYPKSNDTAYQEIFDAVVEAAEQRLGDTPHERIRLENDAEDSLKHRLMDKTYRSTISLGREAYVRYRSTGSSVPAVSGLLDLSPALNPGAQGISLSVDPEFHLRLLKRLLPATKRVHVVFDPAKDQWLIELARESGSKLGIEIVSYSEADATATIRRYLEIIEHLVAGTDALWLPLDPRVFGDDDLVDEILNASWNRRFAVFSSNRGHAQLGALFLLYPHLQKLGEHLATWALAVNGPDRQKTPPSTRIEPLRDVQRAINRRFAEHLGVEIKGETEHLFDVIYGRPRD